MSFFSGDRLRIFLPFALGYFLSYLFRVINAVLAPGLSADMGLGPAQVGMLTAVYFITFGAFQLPLGILLDRFGPRRIEAALLIIAALGAFMFARAETMTGLVIGRGLIGFGVSACLMAAFKAFAVWFSREQLPGINGLQLAAGGMGALAATAPVEAALAFTDWRGVFTVLALLTTVVAAVIFFVVPEQRIPRENLSSAEQLRGLKTVFGSLTFWRIAPWATLSHATFLAIQGLWAGPWLRHVAGLDRAATAGLLFWMAVAMVAGFILLGKGAQRLHRLGISTLTVAAATMGVFMGVLLMIVLSCFAQPSSALFRPGAPVPWILFGFFGTSGVLPYAVLTQSFPAHMAGRVNTALNLLVFMAAFGVQWGIGAVIEWRQACLTCMQWGMAGVAEGAAMTGYPMAFGIMFVLQMAAVFWFFYAGRRLAATVG